MTGILRLPPLALDGDRALFDVTRLVRGIDRRFGTGVDRIDLAIGLDLFARLGARCSALCATPVGPSLLAPDEGAALLGALDRRWSGAGGQSAAAIRLRLIPALARGRLRAARGGFATLAEAETTYVNASHSGQPVAPGGMAAVDPEGRMKRLFYLHDLIPLDHPEYQTERSVARFEAFLAAATAAPVRLVANSRDTARRLEAAAAKAGWPVTGIDVATPWIEPPATAQAGADAPEDVRRLLSGERPYFVTLGTIEPRKNHLLLLHLWREMGRAADNGTAPEPPALAVVGRRGWENEMVLDLLDRCAALRGRVLEFPALADGDKTALLARAQALLFPSFAEGLGIPMLEAAMVGTPVVASDLPALREAAGPDVLFLDPLDGPAWRSAVLRLAERRRA